MNFPLESGGGGPVHDQQAPNRKGRKAYHRHTTDQINHLEAFFKVCPHPDETERHQLSRTLGLHPCQIKFWFQNKRTQTKTQNERAGNIVLRVENERMECENLAMREALMNIICPTCGTSPSGFPDRQTRLRNLQQENHQLKQEHERLSDLVSKYVGKPISQIRLEFLDDAGVGSSSVYQTPRSAGVGSSSVYQPPRNAQNQGIGISLPSLDPIPNYGANPANMLPYPMTSEIQNIEKALMSETAAIAMEELLILLHNDNPFWTNSTTDGRLVLDRQNYLLNFSRANHFKSPRARIESSKYSGEVHMNAVQLVDVFLDSYKWVEFFPSIVPQATTIQVLESGMPESRNGALQLMYEEMHILSALVAPREFYFLRYCKQVGIELWVIVDVSFDFMNDKIHSARCWRLPSGCMIHQGPNSTCKVTWIEHVEVDDETETHRLYRDVLRSHLAYGAERWIITLQRMCERFVFSSPEIILINENAGVVSLPHGRRSTVDLAGRMVKDFCGALNMSSKVNFAGLSEVDNSGVRVSIRKNTAVGQPTGIIVINSTSIWLPLPPKAVFEFITDERTRIQWDILTGGNAVHEVAHIRTGTNVDNYISIIQPLIQGENNVVVVQETISDSLGYMIVYAPLDAQGVNMVINGEDSSTLPILPSGFVITDDGRPDCMAAGPSSRGGPNRMAAGPSSRGGSVPETGGSLLTVAFQILASTPVTMQIPMDSVSAVNTLISSTVQKIEAALNCSGC